MNDGHRPRAAESGASAGRRCQAKRGGSIFHDTTVPRRETAAEQRRRRFRFKLSAAASRSAGDGCSHHPARGARPPLAMKSSANSRASSTGPPTSPACSAGRSAACSSVSVERSNVRAVVQRMGFPPNESVMGLAVQTLNCLTPSNYDCPGFIDKPSPQIGKLGNAIFFTTLARSHHRDLTGTRV